ncbi:hypothetical protein [Oryzifoliimicrobium ureilyticus]|uniref:hypothetical protein n=1 Tax=Oryzifoliimicrobium ureilyticus TaxID=3113724 RepID=UPI0030767FFE
MGKKLERVYHALVEGAAKGLSDDALYDYVIDECPKTSSKRVVKASLLALTDPDLRDPESLKTIYALAIKYRLQDLGVAEDVTEEDDDDVSVPKVTKKAKRRLEASAADVSAMIQ